MKKFEDFINEELTSDDRKKLQKIYNNGEFKELLYEDILDNYNLYTISSINFTSYKSYCCIMLSDSLSYDLLSSDYSRYTVSGNEYMYHYNQLKETMEGLEKFTKDYKDSSFEFQNFKEGSGRPVGLFVPINEFETYFKDIINKYTSTKGIEKYDL